MPRRGNKNSDTVIEGILYTGDENTTGIQLDEPAWSSWLEDAASFYFLARSPRGSFSTRKQKHRQGYFWYAYKRIDGKLHKKYLGMRENVTRQRLEQISNLFQTYANASKE